MKKEGRLILQKCHRIPSELISSCNAEELYAAHNIFINNHGIAKNTQYNSLFMSTGEGGFAPYGYLNHGLQCADSMKTYRYSELPNEQSNVLSNFLLQHKILHPKVKFTECNLMVGNGSTQLFDVLVKKIFHDRSRVAGHDVLLVPTPCYGLFTPQVYQAGGMIVTIPLLPENNYKLTAVQLTKVIIETNQALFSNSLPDVIDKFRKFHRDAKAIGLDIEKLPSFIGEEKTSGLELTKNLYHITKATIELALQHPLLKQKLNMMGISAIPLPPLVPRAIALYHCNIHNLTGKIYSKSEVTKLDNVRRAYDLIIIEDLTHFELRYPSSEPLGFFGHLDDMRQPYKQATLLSISKAYCAAGWRVGAGYFTHDIYYDGHIDLLSPQKNSSQHNGIVDRLFAQTVFISPYQLAAFNCAFAVNDHSKDLYIKHNNQQYFKNAVLFALMLYGVRSIKTLIPPEHVVPLIKHIHKKHWHEDIALLQNGVPHLRLLTMPEGSFFVLVDFSYYVNQYLGSMRLTTGLDFAEALENSLSVETIAAEGMLSNDKPILRFNIACDSIQIIESISRLVEFVQMLTSEPVLLKKTDTPLLHTEQAPNVSNKPLTNLSLFKKDATESIIAAHLSSRDSKPSILKKSLH